MAKKAIARYLLIAAVMVAVFLPSFAKYQELRHKNNVLTAQIKVLERDTKRLEAEKKRLETDITYIEKRARDKIGVARTGEIVINADSSAKE